MAEMPQRYHALVLIAAWCGLRFGELTELRRKDIEIEGKLIHVRRAVVWDAGEPVVGTPKNGLQRDVTMPPDIVDWSESISMRSSNQVQKPCSSTQSATPADRLDRTPSAGIG